MKVSKLIGWFIKIILFILTIILISNNLQPAEVNLFGIYKFYSPVIVIIFGFLILGIIVGMLMKVPQVILLKSQIKKLQNELKKHNKNSYLDEYSHNSLIKFNKEEIN